MKKSRFVLSLTESWWLTQPSLLTPLLIPWAALFMVAVVIRRWCYRVGIKKVTSFPVPVIIIGNIVVGGTGKTPLVIALAKLLKQQGFHPGIVSRGYGATRMDHAIEVFLHSDPVDVGDEPLLIVKKSECPMVIGVDRVEAVQTLLDRHSCDVVLSDDGMQHYALARDLEIVVIDGARRFGNGLALPAGPLREPLSRLNSIQWIVCNGKQLSKTSRFYHKTVLMQFEPQAITSIVNSSLKVTPEEFQNTKIHAVAGIGNPSRFFETLENLGLKIIKHAYPDHHRFKLKDIDFGLTSKVIMTEKDAVKCRSISDDRHYYLPVEALLPEEFQKEFLMKIQSLKGVSS